MARVSTLHKYLPMDQKCEAFLLVAELTVAASLQGIDVADLVEVLDDHPAAVDYFSRYLDVHDYAQALKEPDSHRWRRMLMEMLEVGDEEDDCAEASHGILTVLELATTSIFTESDRLEESEAVRRTDALLDLLDIDVWVGDLRAHYVDAASVVVGRARPDWRPGALSGAQKAAEALMFVDPFTGLAASTVVSWINIESAASAGATPAPVLARLVATCGLLDEDDAVVMRASQALLRDMEKVSRRIEAVQNTSYSGVRSAEEKLAELFGLQEAQANTLAFLNSLASEAPSVPHDKIPTVVGRQLTDARNVIAAVANSVPLAVEDVVQPDGYPRSIWSESNWYVVAQELTQDGSLRLGLRKYTD